MMIGKDGKGLAGSVCLIIIIMLLALGIPGVPQTAVASHKTITVSGDGIENPRTFTLQEMKEMDGQVEARLYSTVNTWPTKGWYGAEGVKLASILAKAGIRDDASLITFKAIDGLSLTFTRKELLEDDRYYFPGLKENHEFFGHIPGSADGAEMVHTILALNSTGGDDLSRMNDRNAPQLIFGQRWITEQTNHAFVKYVSEIVVSTAAPERWAEPTAEPAPGIVPYGTAVELKSEFGDVDKVYYTTDGGKPTYESSMFNIIARRWWQARAGDLAEINRPIIITEDTTIRAVTIGLGRADSEVAGFNYKVAGVVDDDGDSCSPVAKSIKLTVGQMEAIVDGVSVVLDAAPYIDLEASRTLVPLRFVSEFLGAAVVWDPQVGQIRVNKGTNEIVLTAGSRNVLLNGVEHTIDSVAVIIPPGRTFVPLRFVSESLGAQVDYQAGTGEIIITRENSVSILEGNPRR